MPIQTELLSKKHKKNNFVCMHSTLNNYLKYQATNETKRGFARVHVLADNNSVVVGYYTLSATLLPRDAVPEQMQKHIPDTYTGYPAILLGRLAIILEETGKGLGGQLMVDAIEKCVLFSDEIGSRAILVDPIDQEAVAFYTKYMFKALPDSDRMILHIDNNLREHFGLPKLIE